MLFCPQFQVIHSKKICFPQDKSPAYAAYHSRRTARWDSYLPYIFDKWAINYIVGESGKIIQKNSSQAQLYLQDVTSLQTVPLADREAEYSIMRKLHVATGYLTNVKNMKRVWLGVRLLNSCQKLIHAKFVGTNNSRPVVISARMLQTVDACPYWPIYIKLSAAHRTRIVEHKNAVHIFLMLQGIKTDTAAFSILISELHNNDIENDGGGVVLHVGKAAAEKKDICLHFKLVPCYSHVYSASHSWLPLLQKYIKSAIDARVIGMNSPVLVMNGALVRAENNFGGKWLRRVRRFSLCGVSYFVPILEAAENLSEQTPKTFHKECNGERDIVSDHIVGLCCEDLLSAKKKKRSPLHRTFGNPGYGVADLISSLTINQIRTDNVRPNTSLPSGGGIICPLNSKLQGNTIKVESGSVLSQYLRASARDYEKYKLLSSFQQFQSDSGDIFYSYFARQRDECKTCEYVRTLKTTMSHRLLNVEVANGNI
jgi:hypothetical protein